MPDPTPAPEAPKWWSKYVDRAFDLIQTAVLAWIATMGVQNSNKIQAVQSQVDQKAEEISTKQDHAAKKATEVKATLDARTKEDIRVHGVSLYSSWKYLEDVAASTEKPADIAAANEARKAYMDHLKKYDHGGKQP